MTQCTGESLIDMVPNGARSYRPLSGAEAKPKLPGPAPHSASPRRKV